MPSSQKRSIQEQTSDLLAQLIYRAGFGRTELVPIALASGRWSIALPPGLDPASFKVHDLQHMIRAYRIDCEIQVLSELKNTEPIA